VRYVQIHPVTRSTPFQFNLVHPEDLHIQGCVWLLECREGQIVSVPLKVDQRLRVTGEAHKRHPER
jgi:hypothetical protein